MAGTPARLFLLLLVTVAAASAATLKPQTLPSGGTLSLSKKPPSALPSRSLLSSFGIIQKPTSTEKVPTDLETPKECVLKAKEKYTKENNSAEAVPSKTEESRKLLNVSLAEQEKASFGVSAGGAGNISGNATHHPAEEKGEDLDIRSIISEVLSGERQQLVNAIGFCLPEVVKNATAPFQCVAHTPCLGFEGERSITLPNGYTFCQQSCPIKFENVRDADMMVCWRRVDSSKFNNPKYAAKPRSKGKL